MIYTSSTGCVRVRATIRAGSLKCASLWQAAKPCRLNKLRQPLAGCWTWRKQAPAGTIYATNPIMQICLPGSSRPASESGAQRKGAKSACQPALGGVYSKQGARNNERADDQES